MIIKKIHINIILQLIFVSVIVLLFILDKFDLSKINYIFSVENSNFIYLIFLNTLITSVLFFLILSAIIKKKFNFFLICSSFLQGGLVNMFWPGGGLIYKYYKLKNNSNINLAQYSASQAILSIFSLICFFLIAVFFSFIKITKIEFNILFFFFFIYFNNIFSINLL